MLPAAGSAGGPGGAGADRSASATTMVGVADGEESIVLVPEALSAEEEAADPVSLAPKSAWERPRIRGAAVTAETGTGTS